ncbi:prolyl-tRNA editing enzyme YbaK/EbsC (Cys-tRNA(Pro) deacylase) [Hydrogenispora ethanolica]|jgi:prolyl-tRNA editing enzyme YbaK/EbsC (Cys-tRNA(Pro) deacylase)|uniref:Prolyl-tRNA editing enzyme YbaK/EbsC (Cys-tRNA(Pro) deacylase) n=1 Tax=Hydrogenispora ethanolica TaxID=1082276 RepID=A0A4R1S654_HYDET|nr:YbaK/EbsC family protein [Hydrogenispora ethanolica]TCL74270.1 prolyl-tRNA editing enzyme YbaK/EbsC (Cys-tRNA(Pro) deacylase) [Hydrogenispora ethanolica]
MNRYEAKLKDFMTARHIRAEQLIFTQSCHSVQEAASAAGASPEDFVKNICLVSGEGNLIVAIVKGEDSASRSRVGKALREDPPRTATADEILEKTGFPCGGVPSFGYCATFLVDPKVLEKEIVYTGGGSPCSLVRIASRELIRSNNATIIRIRR